MALSSPLNNAVRNALRAISNGCTLPQQKALKELLYGVIREGTTIVNHLTNYDSSVRIGKQAERLRRHLQAMDLPAAVGQRIWRGVEVGEQTIIAYDLGDISKPTAKKMANISRVFDGSRRVTTTGYTTHGSSLRIFACRSGVSPR